MRNLEIIYVAHIIFLSYSNVLVAQVKHLIVILSSFLPLLYILLVLPAKYIQNLTTFHLHTPTQGPRSSALATAFWLVSRLLQPNLNRVAKVILLKHLRTSLSPPHNLPMTSHLVQSKNQVLKKLMPMCTSAPWTLFGSLHLLFLRLECSSRSYLQGLCLHLFQVFVSLWNLHWTPYTKLRAYLI